MVDASSDSVGWVSQRGVFWVTRVMVGMVRTLAQGIDIDRSEAKAMLMSVVSLDVCWSTPMSQTKEEEEVLKCNLPQ